MAYDTTPQDINRGTSGVELPKELAAEILTNAQEESAVMQLAQRVVLPGPGLSIPVITGDAAASWTGEAEEAEVSEATIGAKTMTPYKLTVIELFSNEFRRDMASVYDELKMRLPKAIAKKFDETVFGGVTPGTGFDVLTDATAVAIDTDVYGGFVTADTTVATNDGELNGYVLAPQAKALLLGAKDAQERPLMVPNILTDGAPASILGAPAFYRKAAFKSGTPDVIGVAGDWASARWGAVEGIKISLTDQATVNNGSKQINLWQRGMFAVKAEFEGSFVCQNANKFVRLTRTHV